MNELITLDRVREDEEHVLNAIIKSQGGELAFPIEDATEFLAFTKMRADAYRSICDNTRNLKDQELANRKALESGQRWGIVHLYGQKRLGELTREMDKPNGRPKSAEGAALSKTEQLVQANVADRGNLARQRASDAERIAANPEVLDRVVKRSEERGEIPTKTEVLREIKYETAKAKAAQPQEAPDINRVALDVHGKLTDCRNKLLKLFEHEESIDPTLCKNIRSVIDEIVSIAFKEQMEGAQ